MSLFKDLFGSISAATATASLLQQAAEQNAQYANILADMARQAAEAKIQTDIAEARMGRVIDGEFEDVTEMPRHLGGRRA